MNKQELPSENITARTTIGEPVQPAFATLTIVTLTGVTLQERIPSAQVPQEQALCAQLLEAGVVQACTVIL
jgi:hypothetical protein